MVSLIQYEMMPKTFIIFATIWILALGLGLYWSHKYHLRKKGDYYKKIRGKPYWGI